MRDGYSYAEGGLKSAYEDPLNMEIIQPISELDLKKVYIDSEGPFFGRTISVTDTTIVFDGYFHYDSELFSEDKPICRFIKFQGHTYVLGFTAKRTGEDTSSYFKDEDTGFDICLTPTEILELDYQVLEKDPQKERWPEIIATIKKQNNMLRKAHEDGLKMP